MKYELLMGSEKGVLIDRTPIMLDIRDTFEVSFLLPQKGAYIALFRGEDNIEYKSVIKGGRVKLPPELLNKEQYVSLIVTEVNDEIVVQCLGVRAAESDRLFSFKTKPVAGIGRHDRQKRI